MRLDRYIDDLLASEDLRASTLATYASVLRNHINPALGESNIEGITPAEIRGFFADLRRRNVGPGAIDMTHRLLAKAFNAAISEETITKNPMSAVKRSKPKRSKVEPPTPEELAAIIANIHPRHRAITELMAWTGLRVGEAAGLVMSAWDANTRRIRVDQQSSRFGFGEELKTEAAYRDLVLPKHVNEVLKQHVWKYPTIDGRIFSSRDHNPVNCVTYYRAFENAKRRAGITRPLSPHKLRHHAITAMGRAGVPPKVTQNAVGHTTAALTLDIYTHINDADLTDLADRIDATIAAPVPEQRADSVPVG